MRKTLLLLLSLVIDPGFGAAAPSLTRSITHNGETITLQLQREDLRGEHFELWAQNATGAYEVVTPVSERSYLGTVDEYPGAVSYGILQDDGVFKGGVIFDRGRTWYTLGSSVYSVSPIAQPGSFKYTPTTVAAGQGGSSVYGFDIGIDARYEYFTQRGGGSVAKTLEVIELSVAATRALYVHDALLRPYLGRVIVRTDQAQDPANGLTGGSYLDAIRNHWNAHQTDADRDLVAGVAPSHVWAGLAWVSVVATGSGYSVNDSQGDGNFFNVWRHEMGHNWGLSHYDGGAPEAGTINSNNHFARMSGPELWKVFNHRNSKLWALDNEGALATVNIPPYASYDSRVFTHGGDSPLVIDVLANDHDANGHTLTLAGVQSITAQGGSATIQDGKVVYTPQGNFLGVDSFTYTVQDSSGQVATGAVAVDVRRDDRLRLYLALDETTGTAVDDLSAFNRNGTIFGTDFDTVSAAGPFGNAPVLDGVDDHVRCDNVQLNSNTVTLTAWIKPGATSNPWSGIIFDRTHSANGLNLGGNGELRYHWNNAQYNWNSGLTPTANVWTFVALVIEPVRATMYMNDGTGFQSAVNTSSHAAANFGSVYVGRDPHQASRHFLGAIDEARIYSVAMSPAELQSMYEGGAAEGPNPFDGTTDVGPTDLTWTPSAAAVQYHVYLGTDESAVQNATTASPEYQGAVTSPALANPATTRSATHYWRVDTETAAGTITGTVWSFTRNGLENIVIANRSFEDGPIATGVPPAWTLTTGSASSLGAGPGGSDGDQFLWIGPGVELTQDLGHVLVDGEALSLTFTSSRDYHQRRIQLLAKNGNSYQLLAESTEATGSGSWPVIELTHVVEASDVGQQLALRVTSGNWNEFDDFRLTSIAPDVGPPNTPPVWNTDPVAGADAAAEVPFASTLAGEAADAEGDALTFIKIDGPAWLTVANDGGLLGTPGTGDIGANTFTVRVTDPNGGQADASLRVEVRPTLLLYDLNGSAPGSGAASGGDWDGTEQWSDSSDGDSPTFGWIDGSIPVFSAGDDASGDYAITNTGSRTLRGFGARRGRPHLSGGALETIVSDAEFEVEASALGARIDSRITGSGGLVKTGPGTLVLGESHAYTGDTTLVSGVLEFVDGARFYDGGYNNNAVVTIGSGATWRLPDYSYDGMGQLSDYRQRRVLDGGTIEVTGSSHSSGQDFTVSAAGGTFRYTASGETLVLSGNTNTDTLLGGPLTIDAIGHVSISGSSAVLEGTGSLVKTGGGDLTLSHPGNRFSGDLNVNAGRLLATAVAGTTHSTLGTKSSARTITVTAPASMEWTSNNILGGGGMSAAGLPSIILHEASLATTRFNTIGNLTLQGASLVNANATDPADFDGFQFIGKITATGSAASSIATTTGRGNHLAGGATTEFEVSEPAGTLQIATVLRDGSGDYPGIAALRKTGHGTLILDTANVYSGSTSVEAGTLVLGGSIAGPATVAPSATLGGGGTVAGAVTVQGTLAPDASATLTTGPLTFAANAALLAAGDVSVTGDIDLADAALTVPVAPASGPRVLLAFSGTRSGSFDEASSSLPVGWEIVYDDGAGEVRLEETAEPYLTWIDGFDTGSRSGFAEDADFDGIDNGLEFLIGGDPTVPNDTPLPTFGKNSEGGFTYSFRRDARARGAVAVVAQFSDDLVTWPPARDLIVGLDTASSDPGVEISDQGDHDLVAITIADADPRTFVRLLAETP